jgi:hypothetical protein
MHLHEISNSLGGYSILLGDFIRVHLEHSHLKYYVSYLIIRQHPIPPHYPLVVHVASYSADVLILSVDKFFPDNFRIFRYSRRSKWTVAQTFLSMSGINLLFPNLVPNSARR